jgi:hypothetical protein
MVYHPLEAALYNFSTADGRPQTAALEKNRRPRSTVRGQICKDRLNHTEITLCQKIEPQISQIKAGKICVNLRNLRNLRFIPIPDNVY